MFEQTIATRVGEMRRWLDENYPTIKVEQAHLLQGAPERGYWHAGYCCALTDILNLLDKSLQSPVNKDR